MSNAQTLIDPAILDALPNSAASHLLRFALEQEAPPAARQVFVNRALRMEKIRFVGFDLDWTLADYDRDTMSRLAFELALDRLVHRFGYPKAILGAVFRPGFTRRGLMLDIEEGLVVKMNRHRYVGRAYRGNNLLGRHERATLYRREPINPASDRFYHVDTLFELPEVNIFAELIDLAHRTPPALTLPSYQQLFKDVRAAIDSIHADGSLKAGILADLPQYLPLDPELILALRRLALGGRKLLLITNSEWYFTNAICQRLFHQALPGLDDWREIFDLVIVSAGKPTFFRKRRPFVRLDDAGEPLEEVDVPAWNGVYAGGSRAGLMELLDCHGEEVLYIGDHIYGDIVSTKLASTWRTGLVVSELEDELSILSRLSGQQRIMDALRAELGSLGGQMDDLHDVVALYQELMQSGSPVDTEPDASLTGITSLLGRLREEHRGLRRHARRVQTRLSAALNPYWGSLFKQGTNKSFFGNQVDDFACVYASRVSNFAFYGRNHYFRVTRDAMMHDQQ